jgi:DNA polymerase II small subunit
MKVDFELFYNKGIRLTEDAFSFLQNNEISEQALKKLLSDELYQNSPFLTKEMIDFILAEEKIPIKTIVNRPADFSPIAKEVDEDIKIFSNYDITGKSDCKGKTEDFITHFHDRFKRISQILRMRLTNYSIVKTNKLKEEKNGKFRVIGMLSEKRITQKGNLLFTIEDDEGTAKVVIPQSNRDAFKIASKLLLDDIVAYDGQKREELFIVESISFPDIPIEKEQKKSERDLAIVYLSDLHFGSKKFLDKEFAKFLNWLSNPEEKKELAGKIKYIIVAGDIADGIGIYPEQEKELAVKDIYMQYEMFEKALEDIPEYIRVIAIPGNHDAVRRAEPQPALDSSLIKSKEIIRLGNPSFVAIEGLKHLLYHGTSLDSIIANIGLSYEHPEEAMLELLKRRHLSPIYGENLIVPEKKDYLVIEEEPDVMHVGHVHKNGFLIYRGKLLLNSGTFQDRTAYQIKLGHKPSPALVPILETKTGKLHHISFKELT